MRKQHSPKERRHCSHTSEITEGWGTTNVPTPYRTSRLLASRAPDTASGQRRAATASMTASGHEKRREGSNDRKRSQRTPGEQAKAAAVNDSGHSSHRSRQSSFGGVASGQKTATGHTETTRANAVKPLAVRRLPTITPRMHKVKQQTR